MKGRISILIVVAVCLSWGWIGMAGKAEAAIIYDFEDILVFGEDDSGLKFEDEFNYTHELDDLSPTPDSLTAASLSITYEKYTGDEKSELWFISSGSDILIGELLVNPDPDDSYTWTVDLTNEDIKGDILSEIMGEDSWSLSLILKDNTIGTDKIILYSSTLSGEYTAVPIPGTALLLFSGLAGLVCFKQTRKK